MAGETWEKLSEEEKEGQIFSQLTLIDLQHADPSFYAWYQETKGKTTDAADEMRLDAQMVQKIVQLRQEGRMLLRDELELRAKSMISLDSDAMRKAFQDFAQDISQPPQP